jgi:hypothetical protein
MTEKTYAGNITISAGIDIELFEVIDSLAEDTGVCIAEHIRRALVIYLDYLDGNLDYY